MKKLGTLIVLLLATLLVSRAEDINYTNYSLARLTYVKGNTYIQRSADLAYEEGVINMPIGEGDRIGTTDGRVEIYFGRGNYFRLDSDTKVDFLSLPTKSDDLTQVRLWSGNVYFSVASLEREKSIEIHSSDISIYVLDNGLYRIDVRPNQATEIFVFRGLVEAAGETGSVLIKEAQRLEATDGRFISSPTRFYTTAGDSFDGWSEYRESMLRERVAQTYLPDDMYDYEQELSTYGHWTYVAPYGHVWVPGGLDLQWQPYRNGRWIWMPACGWTWLPYEPWGWVTFHYGRWHWAMGIGWYWIPTNVWGPGWVSWYRGYDYFAWAPLSYYGYPGVIINNIYYDRYTAGYYPQSSRALVLVHKDQLQSKQISKVALSSESLKEIGKIQMTQSAPEQFLRKDGVSIEKLSGNKIILRKNEDTASIKDFSKVTRDMPQDLEASRGGKTVEERTLFDSASSKEKYFRKETGYPSSAEISMGRDVEDPRTKSSKSAFSRFYDYISKESQKSSDDKYSGTSSRNSSSAIEKSRSSTGNNSASVQSSGRSTSRTSTGKSTAVKSSSSKTSTRTKKKK